MNSPFNNVTFSPVSQNSSNNFMQLLQQARQNPQAFNDFVRQNNPQAYQQAMQIMQSGNPQQVIIQMLQSRGLNPAMFNLPKL
jgi:hypothetical protein